MPSASPPFYHGLSYPIPVSVPWCHQPLGIDMVLSLNLANHTCFEKIPDPVYVECFCSYLSLKSCLFPLRSFYKTSDIQALFLPLLSLSHDGNIEVTLWPQIVVLESYWLPYHELWLTCIEIIHRLCVSDADCPAAHSLHIAWEFLFLALLWPLLLQQRILILVSQKRVEP